MNSFVLYTVCQHTVSMCNCHYVELAKPFIHLLLANKLFFSTKTTCSTRQTSRYTVLLSVLLSVCLYVCPSCLAWNCLQGRPWQVLWSMLFWDQEVRGQGQGHKEDSCFKHKVGISVMATYRVDHRSRTFSLSRDVSVHVCMFACLYERVLTPSGDPRRANLWCGARYWQTCRFSGGLQTAVKD